MYEIYKKQQDKLYESDFDNEVKKFLEKTKKVNQSVSKKNVKVND